MNAEEIFDTETELRMAAISEKYQSANWPVEFMTVVLDVSGKSSFENLIETGTPQDWNKVYEALRAKNLI